MAASVRRRPLLQLALSLAVGACTRERVDHASAPSPITNATDVRIPMPMAPDGGPRVAVSLSDASASNDAGFGTGLSGGSGEGTIGLGNIGTIGRHSAGHGGSWATSTGAGHGPIIRTGVPVVRGGLSIETVRRVVRRHLPEVQYCYEAALTQYPDMEGRVTVQFDLSPSGAVVTSGVVQSTLANASVETCLARAARRWVFPSPAGGGVVRVSYPFVLRPYE